MPYAVELRGITKRFPGVVANRDIELRTATQVPEDDAIVVDVLQKMVKQRRESIAMYQQGGRQ